jgi:hypothetical protein
MSMAYLKTVDGTPVEDRTGVEFEMSFTDLSVCPN